MAELHFLRPDWFYVFIPLIVLIMVLYHKTKSKRTKQQSSWKNEVDAHLLDHVLISFSAALSPSQAKKSWYQAWMFAAFFWIMSVIALAGPSWDKTAPIQIIPDIAPLLVVLDLSPSMLVTDVYPNRLKHAQYKLRILIDKMITRPIALVVFSAQAHSVIPLTQDSRLVTHLLEYMTPEIMPATGTNRSAGLQLAANILSQNKSNKGQILLVTDGIDETTVNTIKQLASQDLEVLNYIVATKQGGYIPETENGNKLTDNGKDFSALEEPGLTQLAQKDSGYYELVSNDNKDILNLLSQATAFHRSYLESSYLNQDEKEQQTVQVWRDRGGWLIFLLLPLALLLFRPGRMAVLLPGYICGVFFFNPVPAEANGWQKFWYNSNALGSMALDNNEPKLAEQLFSEPFWLGVTQYRQQKFMLALKNFSRVISAEGFYNKGNTLVHLKRYKEAMDAYNTALRMNGSLKEARHNLQLVEQFRQQTQTNETAEKNSFNRSNNKKLKKISEPFSNKSDKNPTGKQEKEQEQEKKLTNDTGKKSLMNGAIKNSMTSRAEDQSDYKSQVPDKTEQSESTAKPAKPKSHSIQESKKININDTKSISHKKQKGKQKAKQKHDKNAQVKAKKSLESSNTSNQQKKNKAEIISEPDSRQLKNSEQQVQQASNDQLKADLKKEAEKSTQQTDKKNNTTKDEALEKKQKDENNRRVMRSEAGKTTVSEQGKRHQLSKLKDEQFQSLEHWLDSIKDDPTDLLKEKFKREYKRASRFSGKEL